MFLPSLVAEVATEKCTCCYNKNPCLCRNRKCPNKVHHQDLGSMRPQAECFPGSDDAPCWEICDFCMGMGSCFYLTHPFFCMNCVLVMGENSRSTLQWIFQHLMSQHTRLRSHQACSKCEHILTYESLVHWAVNIYWLVPTRAGCFRVNGRFHSTPVAYNLALKGGNSQHLQGYHIAYFVHRAGRHHKMAALACAYNHAIYHLKQEPGSL